MKLFTEEEISTPNHLKIRKEREGSSTIFRGNEENYLQKTNDLLREKMRMNTFSKVEASPLNKNQNTLIRESQQAFEVISAISNHKNELNKEKLFEYDFEEGKEFQAYYYHNNIREVIKNIRHVKKSNGSFVCLPRKKNNICGKKKVCKVN